MEKLLQIVRSRTVWTFVAIFAFNGLQAIAPMVSGSVSMVVNSLLGILGVYFRANPQAQL